MKRITLSITALLLLVSVALSLASCASSDATDLLSGNRENVEGKEADRSFSAVVSDFSVNMLKDTYDGKNYISSPLSLMIALGMLTNGAEGETKAEIEELLGIKETELAKYISAYIDSLDVTEKSKVVLADSLWMREGKNVREDFIMHNVNFYRAELYTADFTKKSTVDDVNAWISDKTDGMIKDMLKKLDPDTAMLLINTILFEAEWINKDEREDIPKMNFRSEDGTVSQVDMMFFEEKEYIETKDAVGFVKYYTGNRYALVGLLPNEDISFKDYISSLNGDYLNNALKSATTRNIHLLMPRFEYGLDLNLVDYLKEKGMIKAFSEGFAEFGGITPDNDMFVSDVLHSAKISNNTNGTKAAAATVIIMEDESCSPMPEDIVNIRLDRPFVYFIYDTQSGIPLFVGAFNNK